MREPEPALITVAAFDFDGTLTRGDTLAPYLRDALGTAGFALALLKSSPWLAAYALRLIDNERAKARLLRAAFAGRRVDEVEAWTERFVAQRLPALWDRWAQDELARQRARGACCVIVSASPGVYLHRVARELGLEAAICTELEVQDARYTGRLATRNCHGAQKPLRLDAWLAQRFGASAAVALQAYGDTAGDLPLLRRAEQAWYRGRPWTDGPAETARR